MGDNLEPGYRQMHTTTSTSETTQAYALTSIAISLKRIADALERANVPVTFIPPGMDLTPRS